MFSDYFRRSISARECVCARRVKWDETNFLSFSRLLMEGIDSSLPTMNCHTLTLEPLTELRKSQTSLLSGISDDTSMSITEVSHHDRWCEISLVNRWRRRRKTTTTFSFSLEDKKSYKHEYLITCLLRERDSRELLIMQLINKRIRDSRWWWRTTGENVAYQIVWYWLND